MPKYLWQASYTAEGAKGLLKEGGSSRRRNLEKLVQGLGGRVEAFYYAFGEDDVYVIAELPDHTTATALSLTIASSGAVRVRTTILLGTEEVDEATKKSIAYRPPGA
jgi:uncharacterized protein with GYD domain